MSWKRFLLGAGVGFIVGAVLKDQMTKELISPEKALRVVKQKLGKQGVIEGSWIHMIPESYEKNLLDYTVYRGGVSCTIEGEFYQFDFIVDGNTGAILELTSQD
ncbi:PepSY domain-containing protein [Anaerobacillus sp. CMMVII]|uniref:PepSY domain-containing protein n=1 Tax=Anaerobacillus sp. CMMVII TaxID=2755588 RepID=UPI0021B7A902|nr:PepSY domain-containing protein [Anaerobacillus sp. CMMVII]MCT8137319.1 PepSY domain-containing protein [Anaerobacillus sp. CMMVII]